MAIFVRSILSRIVGAFSLSKLIEFAVETLGAHSQPKEFAKISTAAFRGLLFSRAERSAYFKSASGTHDFRLSKAE
jgi:hypothetical protein